MNQHYILVIGSCNTDMVIKTTSLPRPGETVLGGSFFMTSGGKGANQAVAAKRLGAAVAFICKTGNDIFGTQSVAFFEEEGIDTSHILSDSAKPSGVALITVDKNAENCIVVAPGANASLSPEDIDKAKTLIEKAALVLIQFEIPEQTVFHVVRTAAAAGVKVIVNPAPARSIPDDILELITILTPNQQEAEMLSGCRVIDVETAKQAATIIAAKGVQTVIITLGAAGALLYDQKRFIMVKSTRVQAIDTTAAGDVFNGALAVALSENKTMEASVNFSCLAAAISVTKMGAQSSIPYRHELKQFATQPT